MCCVWSGLYTGMLLATIPWANVLLSSNYLMIGTSLAFGIAFPSTGHVCLDDDHLCFPPVHGQDGVAPSVCPATPSHASACRVHIGLHHGFDALSRSSRHLDSVRDSAGLSVLCEWSLSRGSMRCTESSVVISGEWSNRRHKCQYCTARQRTRARALGRIPYCFLINERVAGELRTIAACWVILYVRMA